MHLLQGVAVVTTQPGRAEGLRRIGDWIAEHIGSNANWVSIYAMKEDGWWNTISTVISDWAKNRGKQIGGWIGGAANWVWEMMGNIDDWIT